MNSMDCNYYYYSGKSYYESLRILNEITLANCLIKEALKK